MSPSVPKTVTEKRRCVSQASKFQEIFVSDEEEVTVNVNTLRELRNAKHLFRLGNSVTISINCN